MITSHIIFVYDYNQLIWVISMGTISTAWKIRPERLSRFITNRFDGFVWMNYCNFFTIRMAPFKSYWLMGVTYLEFRKPRQEIDPQINYFPKVWFWGDRNITISRLLPYIERREFLIFLSRFHWYSLLAAILDAQLTETIRKLASNPGRYWWSAAQLVAGLQSPGGLLPITVLLNFKLKSPAGHPVIDRKSNFPGCIYL